MYSLLQHHSIAQQAVVTVFLTLFDPNAILASSKSWAQPCLHLGGYDEPLPTSEPIPESLSTSEAAEVPSRGVISPEAYPLLSQDDYSFGAPLRRQGPRQERALKSGAGLEKGESPGKKRGAHHASGLNDLREGSNDMIPAAKISSSTPNSIWKPPSAEEKTWWVVIVSAACILISTATHGLFLLGVAHIKRGATITAAKIQSAEPPPAERSRQLTAKD